MSIELHIDGRLVTVADERANLLDVLRSEIGITSVKDGCAPQGQCGCCTVLVDGDARVACVTPVRRIAGRKVTTLDGLDPEVRQGWADAFVATGASQCGFCTPGIICRLEAVRSSSTSDAEPGLDNPLAAHLCRCTGWQTIIEAYGAFGTTRPVDTAAASMRATIEGRAAQRVGTDIALGRAAFSADTVPPTALFAVPTGDGSWSVADTLLEARAATGRVQGRRTTRASTAPINVPAGDWLRTLQTSWTEPAPLETDTVWCQPGGEPSSAAANGGAFGAKLGTELGSVARRLADERDCPVAVVLSREDSVRMGAKRPPLGAGITADGSGRVIVARTAGIADAIRASAPGLDVEEVDIAGPPTSSRLRGAGWVEAAVLMMSLGAEDRCSGPEGGTAAATVGPEGISVTVDAGSPLDEIVLRSYCIGAAHMAYSWVTSESLSIDSDGSVDDLTIRSFGILKAADTPPIEIEIVESDREPVNGSDAVYAAVAAATWRFRDYAPVWPTG